MKIKFLIAGILSLASTTVVFAQKGVLSDAAEAYNKYTILKGSGPKLARPNLDNAKMLIDKAAANDKTANLPQTYAVKGGVYSALALLDTVTSTSTPLFITAEESLKKAKELDTKGENKKLIDDSYLNLVQYNINKGRKNFNAHDYNAAYESFKFYLDIRPDDTLAMFYTGLAALNAKKYPEAIANYHKLLKTNYSGNLGIYNDLTTICLYNKDTTQALEVIAEAVAKYPNDAKLANREIQICLATGKIKEVTDKLDKAIIVDPKNKSLYYYRGYIYLQNKDYEKAAGLFSKALEIDANYYDANLCMGKCYLNPGIDVFNKAQKLPVGTKAGDKAYTDMSAQATALFDKALPYCLKAAEIEPKSEEALSDLRRCYLGKKDNTNAAAIQARIKAL
jgi:tetratricopeptide (TPR) repeat protein